MNVAFVLNELKISYRYRGFGSGRGSEVDVPKKIPYGVKVSPKGMATIPFYVCNTYARVDYI